MSSIECNSVLEPSAQASVLTGQDFSCAANATKSALVLPLIRKLKNYSAGLLAGATYLRISSQSKFRNSAQSERVCRRRFLLPQRAKSARQGLRRRKPLGAESTNFAPILIDEYQANSGMAAGKMNGQGFVTGHDLSRAVCRQFSIPASQVAEKGLFSS